MDDQVDQKIVTPCYKTVPFPLTFKLLNLNLGNLVRVSVWGHMLRFLGFT